MVAGLRSIELFAGAGGLGIGLSKAGFRPLQVVERDRWCCDTIRENRQRKVRPVGSWPVPTELDIREIQFDDWQGKVDLVSGGPPCQPFSLGGLHKAQTDSRDMWPEAVRVVRQTRPRAFIFENVKGLRRTTFAAYYNYVLLQLHYPSIARAPNEIWQDHLRRLQQHHTGRPPDLEEYRVIADVLNAANYGVPQRRERIVFVGFRADQSIEWSPPKARFSRDALLWSQCRSEDYWERHRVAHRDRTLDAALYARGMALKSKPAEDPWVTTRDAIADLPDPELHPRKARQHFNHNLQPGARSYPGHTGSALDEPAKTLKAGVHGVPGGENMLRRPDGTVRYFTVRESARLQTFPDEYAFHGSWSETMRQLGNAVPVRLAELVAGDVARVLRMG